MNRKIKARIDAALERGDHIVFCGMRGYQKKLIQNYIFMKQFPKGKVAIISPDGIRESELADYEEIETKFKQVMKDET
jgi:hypothetical protein